MCGVFGFYLQRPLKDSEILQGRRCLELLHHRGPDNTGVHVDSAAGLFLGHTRLSIIDTSDDGNQPMARDGRVVSYNGEIYNYLELAEELRNLGVRLTTGSDTEVLLRSWVTWGPQSLERFDGMFAFALFEEGKLHLVTDPFGEKPMYWVDTGEGIYFSSEPQPLVKMLNLEPEFSQEDIAAFLTQGYLTAPSTGFRNLVRMTPATHLSVSPDSGISTGTYWSPSPPETRSGRVHELSELDLDRIVETLAESLKRRFRADVPSVLFLSSGVDSSLVAALTARELNHDIPALTVGFPGQSVADESERASIIARALQLPHQVLQSRDDDSGPPHLTLYDLYGEPNANLTALAAYQMSRVAADQAKVAISGLGGDEIFFGYGRHAVFYRWRRWLRTGKPFRKVAAVAYRIRSRGAPSVLSNILAHDDGIGFHHFRNFATWNWLQSIPEQRAWAGRPLVSDRLAPETESRHIDMIDMMPGSFIPAVERASMRASLEVRTPFLSRRLYEVIATMDPRAFMAFGQKSVQKRILARYLPERLFDERKLGFNYPDEVYLAEAPKPKAIPGVSLSQLNEAWSHRSQRYWSTLAVRMSVLGHFTNKDLTRPVAGSRSGQD